MMVARKNQAALDEAMYAYLARSIETAAKLGELC